MSEPVLLGLVRLFPHRAWAEDFRAGRIRFTPLSQYHDLPQTDRQRHDRLEGISALLRPSEVRVLLGAVELSRDDLAGPVLVSEDAATRRAVCCFYALDARGRAEVSDDDLAPWTEELQINEACREFGEHVVAILNGAEFFARVRAAVVRAGLRAEGEHVTYFDAETLHGRVPAKPGFAKSGAFWHQHEYRLALDFAEAPTVAYYLECGNLSDITLLTTVDAFNADLGLRRPVGKTG